MNDEKRISFLEWLMLVMVILLLVDSIYTVAYATNYDRNNSEAESNSASESLSTSSVGDVSMTAGSMTGGDVSVGGDSNRAYAMSLGDVDINDCYRSYQVAVFFQGSQLNYWCMADSLDAKGLHKAAAKTRCKLKGYRDLFDDETACIVANTMSVIVPEPPKPPESDKDDEDYHEQHEQDFAAAMEALEARLAASERKVAQAKAEARKAREAAQTAPAVSPEVQYEISAYEQRRANAQMALKGEK